MSIITICSRVIVNADSPQDVSVTLSGYVALSGSGGWANGINLSGSLGQNSTSFATWSGSNGSDYIEFVDRTGYPGGYIKVYVKNDKFSYSGNGVGGTGLLLGNNMYIATDSNPTIGTDDYNKNINIISGESCEDATENHFFLNSDFYQASNQMRISSRVNNMKLLFLSTVPCTHTVKLFFDSVKLAIPKLSTSGTYSNNIVLVVFDGIP